MKVYLPKTFSFKQAYDLVRVGRDYDGGYLVSQSDIKKSEVLIGLGINDDWSFEEDFLNRKEVSIYAYDGSISLKNFFKNLIKSSVRIDNLKLFYHWFKVIVKYRIFFSKPNVHHIKKFVGLNSTSNIHCKFSDVITSANSNNIFLKIDVEGSEYRFLDELIENQDSITGAVIEFHDCDIHLKVIEKFINKFKLNLVHIHTNCGGAIRSDGLPTVLELTFSKHGKLLENFTLPHKFDMPNGKGFLDHEIIIN